MKKIIFLFLYFVALPIIGYEVTGKMMGAFAFMALFSVPMYFCYYNKNTYNILLKVMH